MHYVLINATTHCALVKHHMIIRPMPTIRVKTISVVAFVLRLSVKQTVVHGSSFRQILRVAIWLDSTRPPLPRNTAC